MTAGWAIYDAIQNVACEVSTVCMGMCASMGAFLLASGTKGKRIVTPNSEVMIHQPSAGTQGMVTDMEINIEHFQRVKRRINATLAKHTGKSEKQIKRILSEITGCLQKRLLHTALLTKSIMVLREGSVTNHGQYCFRTEANRP